MYTTIQTSQSLHINSPPKTPKIHFDIKKKETYTDAVTQALNKIDTPETNIKKGELLFTTCVTEAKKIFLRKPQRTPKSTRVVANLKNNKRILQTLKFHIKENSSAPLVDILTRKVIKDLPEISIHTVDSTINEIKKILNNKSRKRRERLRKSWEQDRSTAFHTKN